MGMISQNGMELRVQAITRKLGRAPNPIKEKKNTKKNGKSCTMKHENDVDSSNNLICQLMARKPSEDEDSGGEINLSKYTRNPNGKLRLKVCEHKKEGNLKIAMGGFHKKVKNDLKKLLND